MRAVHRPMPLPLSPAALRWPPPAPGRRTLRAPAPALRYNGYVRMGTIADPAFKSISRTHTGFHIWRIENMQVVPLPKSQWGSFYDGDSYIVYAASESGKPSGPDAKVLEVRGTSMEVHIHFWLGAETSQDEAGVAAYKTVELDDWLGGGPVQHREAQGSESGRFKAYFKEGIRVLRGGVASGLTAVTDQFEPRLFRVKGRRQPVVAQQPSVSWDHLNSGDVFILDTKDVVFLWIGAAANNMEKLQATLMASKLRDEHGASALVFVDDGKEQTLAPGEKKIFNSHLKLSERRVKSAEEAGADEVAEQTSTSQLTLYQCSDEDGTYKVVEIKSGPLLQSDLCSDDSFIIDAGPRGCWVWIGKRASHQERLEAVRNAHGFVTKKGYPASTPVTRVVDGGEPAEFKVLFSSWRERNQTVGMGKSQGGRVAVTVHTKLDAAALHEKPQLASDNQLWDDGSGECTVWRVHNFELEEVPARLHGLFFAGDSYVVHYAYWAGGAQRHVLYYWLGQHSPADERGSAALHVVEKDAELGGAAVQVRVPQGREPAHFLAMFRRGILILNGGYASSFDGEGAEDTGLPRVFLLQVRGNQNYNTRATQVDLRAASLNSNDVFVLKGKTNCFVWSGKGSTGDEREMAKHIADFASKGDYAFVSEGQEKAEFWAEIGGEEEYASDKRLADDMETLPPRLFQLSNASGTFKAEEIVNFQQNDLVQEDVMMLDIHDALYLWIGKDANEQEQKLSIETAVEYLATDPTGRDPETPILKVKQGHEPPTFIGFFGVWDHTLWENNKTFEAMRMEIEELNPEIHVEDDDDLEGNLNDEMGFGEQAKYPLEFLQDTVADELPEDVDKLHKELHLTKEDFQIAFKMNYETFSELPTWKQTNLKKSVRLF